MFTRFLGFLEVVLHRRPFNLVHPVGPSLKPTGKRRTLKRVRVPCRCSFAASSPRDRLMHHHSKNPQGTTQSIPIQSTTPQWLAFAGVFRQLGVEIPQPHRGVATPGGQLSTIRRKGHAQHRLSGGGTGKVEEVREAFATRDRPVAGETVSGPTATHTRVRPCWRPSCDATPDSGKRRDSLPNGSLMTDFTSAARFQHQEEISTRTTSTHLPQNL